MVRNRAYRLYIGFGIFLVTATLIFTLVPQALTGFHTVLFVLQVLDSPFKPQPWFTAEPSRQAVTYPRPQGQGVADIYRILDDKQRAAVLLFLGANAAGRDDPDVINLGKALSRAGYAVMLHWSPTMGLQADVDPEEIENLVWAFRYLTDQSFVDRNRVGLGGFSVGASFALVAAADSRIRDEVMFVNAFGGYYDARDLFLQVASSSRFYRGQNEPWPVDKLTWRVFANELIESLNDPSEQALLTRYYLERQDVPVDQLASLSDEGQSVRRLLEGTTLDEARNIYDGLPPAFQQVAKEISPSTYIDDVTARLMIMHDDGDLLIPVAESRRLADALEGRENFRYTETQVFEHVRPGTGGNLWTLGKEAFKLYRHMYSIIGITA